MGAASYLEDIEERRVELTHLIAHAAENIGAEQMRALARSISLADRAVIQLQELITHPDMNLAAELSELRYENQKLIAHNNELVHANQRAAEELTFARQQIKRLNNALSTAKELRAKDRAEATRTIEQLRSTSVHGLFAGNARIKIEHR